MVFCPGWMGFQRHQRTVLAIGLCASLLTATATAQTFSNPLVTPAFPQAGPTADGPADPVVVDFEGRYYVYPTGNGTTYKAMWSHNLVDWHGDFTAFTIPGGSAWKNGNLWAPEIEYVDGRFFMYYTAGDGGFGGQHVGLAESLSPTGPFVDRSFNAPFISVKSIDGELFQDGEDLYLYYAKLDENPFKLSIWVVEMANPRTIDLNSTPTLCVDPVEPWEAVVAEGPTVLKRNGKYYMFYSAFGALEPNYAVALAVADHPMGPWIKQPTPYNPFVKRNDTIGLYGPGHGDWAVGPDGISDWYVHHRKLNPDSNFKRELGLDRILALSRDGTNELRWTSSGGTTSTTPRPRMPFEWTDFEDANMPQSFEPLAGNWNMLFGDLQSSASATLLIKRALSPANRGNFQFEWWLQATNSYREQTCSSVEFSVDAERAGTVYRTGFRVRSALDAVEFIEVDSNENVTVLATGSLPANLNWRTASRRVTWRKWGDTWSFDLNRQRILTYEHETDVGWAAWVKTTQMPVQLPAYKQTIAFVDEFEDASASSPQWSFLNGNWSYDAPTAFDDGFLRQTDQVNDDWKFAICNQLALCEFDLSADFRLVNQVTGNGLFPKHGLVHNYVDSNNHALVFIDDQFDVIATNARINGSLQAWLNADTSLPDTFGVADYRKLSVTTDNTTGEFVYSLNGKEMIRRAYPTLPSCGRAGLVTELSQVQFDNFRFSGTAPTEDVDSDGVAAGSDNCPCDANTTQADADGDGVGDACDRCPGTAAGLSVNSLGCPPAVTGDADLDGDIDSDDSIACWHCLSGADQSPVPGGGQLSTQECLDSFDFNRDNDVDVLDYAALRGSIVECTP